MSRPNNDIRLPFQLLFPLLVFYYAAIKDKRNQGEYSTDMTWEGLCAHLEKRWMPKLTRSQFESLVYNYKVAVADKRRPWQILKEYEKNYIPLLKQLQALYPHLLKELPDGEIKFSEASYVEQKTTD